MYSSQKIVAKVNLKYLNVLGEANYISCLGKELEMCVFLCFWRSCLTFSGKPSFNYATHHTDGIQFL